MSQGVGNHDGIDFDSAWGTLSASLKDIHTKNASMLSFEQLYRNAYRLVLKKQGEQLYNNVQAFEAEWLQSVVKPEVLAGVSPRFWDGTINSGSDAENSAIGEKLLKVLKNAWEDHILCMNMTTDVLMYLVSSDSNTCTRRSSVLISCLSRIGYTALRITGR